MDKKTFENLDLRPQPKTKREVEQGIKKIAARQKAFKPNRLNYKLY